MAHGFTAEVGATVAQQIQDRIVAELFDPEIGRGILDPDNVSVDQLQAAIQAQLEDLLGPVGDALEVMRAVEEAILPDVVNEILDDLEDELADFVEAAGGDRIRDSIDKFVIPESIGDGVCEGNE